MSEDSSYDSYLIDNVDLPKYRAYIDNCPFDDTIVEFTNLTPDEDTIELITSLPQLLIHEKEKRSYLMRMKDEHTIGMYRVTKKDVEAIFELNKDSETFTEAMNEFVGNW